MALPNGGLCRRSFRKVFAQHIEHRARFGFVKPRCQGRLGERNHVSHGVRRCQIEPHSFGNIAKEFEEPARHEDIAEKQHNKHGKQDPANKADE
jgi:hypothetical protein